MILRVNHTAAIYSAYNHTDSGPERQTDTKIHTEHQNGERNVILGTLPNARNGVRNFWDWWSPGTLTHKHVYQLYTMRRKNNNLQGEMPCSCKRFEEQLKWSLFISVVSIKASQAEDWEKSQTKKWCLCSRINSQVHIFCNCFIIINFSLVDKNNYFLFQQVLWYIITSAVN